eukprot:SAG22_NODE_2393_length_2622_cov_2.419738_2_plen_188_part_00
MRTKAPPFCCASTVLLSKIVPFCAAVSTSCSTTTASSSLSTSSSCCSAAARCARQLLKGWTGLPFALRVLGWRACLSVPLRLFPPYESQRAACCLRLSLHLCRALASTRAAWPAAAAAPGQSVRTKALPFCCASTAFPAETAPFRAVPLGQACRPTSSPPPGSAGKSRSARRRLLALPLRFLSNAAA